MKKFLFLFILLVLGIGCVSVERQRMDIESDIALIYSDYSDEIQQFFVEEAVDAGVRTIRAMKSSEKRTPIHPNEIQGCAYGFWQKKLILIEVNEPLCIKLGHLAHEIGHIGSKCGAHNDIFYKYNFDIARRYEKAFPIKENGLLQCRVLQMLLQFIEAKDVKPLFFVLRFNCHITSISNRFSAQARLTV